MTVFGVQKDPATDNWYFIIWADQQRERVAYRSDPLFAEEEDAARAAMEWLARGRR
jgi:hypothetical protein